MSITVGSVIISAGQPGSPLQNAGTTITAGVPVYLDPATSTWLKMLVAGTTVQAGLGVRFGVSLHAALSGQPLAVLESGIIAIGATVVVGTFYCPSNTAGNIMPLSDLVTSTWKITILGQAVTSTTIDMTMKRYTGISVP